MPISLDAGRFCWSGIRELDPAMHRFSHPRFPPIIMFRIQLKPALFATDDRDLAEVTGAVNAISIQGAESVQPLEFERLLEAHR